MSKEPKIKPIVIVGAGGMGRDTQWLIERINEEEPTYEILGYIDDGIQQGSIIDGYPILGHDDEIGDYNTLYPGVLLSGDVHLKTETEIGTGSQIIQGLHITDEVIMGAGSTVIEDINEAGTYVGVPVRRVNDEE